MSHIRDIIAQDEARKAAYWDWINISLEYDKADAITRRDMLPRLVNAKRKLDTFPRSQG